MPANLGQLFHPPRSARGKPEKGNGAPEKGCSRVAACLTVSTMPQPGPPRGHRHLRHTQKAGVCPLPTPPMREQTGPLKAAQFTGNQVLQKSPGYGSLMETR